MYDLEWYIKFKDFIYLVNLQNGLLVRSILFQIH